MTSLEIISQTPAVVLGITAAPATSIDIIQSQPTLIVTPIQTVTIVAEVAPSPTIVATQYGPTVVEIYPGGLPENVYVQTTEPVVSVPSLWVQIDNTGVITDLWTVTP